MELILLRKSNGIFQCILENYYVFHDRVTLFFANNFLTQRRITMKFLHNFFYTMK